MPKSKEVKKVDQPTTEKFYNKNIDVLKAMLKESKQSFHNIDFQRILPMANSFAERLSMRTVIIDWLKQVNDFRMSKPGVLALTIDIMDQYVYSLSIKGGDVNSVNYQCIGSSAYNMASKIEEVLPINTYDLSKFTSDSCSVSDITELEILISFQLEFNVKSINPIDFIYFLTNFINITDYRKECLRHYAIKNYLYVINDFNIKLYPCHVIGINSIILGYHDLEDFSTIELDKIIKIFVDLIELEKSQLSNSYDYMQNAIDAIKCSNSFDGDSSTEILNDP